MKQERRTKRPCAALLLCAALLAGCTAPERCTAATLAPGAQSAAQDPGSDAAGAEPGAAVSLTARIVDGAEDGNLLLADLGETGGLYRLRVQPEDAVTIGGQAATAAGLADGMALTVIFDGRTAESWPAQIAHADALEAAVPPGGGYYDLCGLYLKVLDDLWAADPALNEGIPVAGLDLSQAPGGLSESEKDGIAWRFGETHGVEVVRGTLEELIGQGYITQDEDSQLPYWENGCLFSITAAGEDGLQAYSLPVLRFDAQKWCSGTGAYFFTDCTAVWPEFGPWSEYTVGAHAIS